MPEMIYDHSYKRTEPVLNISFKIQIENTQIAQRNRAQLDAAGLCCVNIISSLGVGATSLLEHTVVKLQQELRIAVIEGDLFIEWDAARLRAHGVPVVDLTHEHACHLNADLLADGLCYLQRDGDLARFDLLLVEHVGDLICPSVYALGEHARVVLVDINEDEEKPLTHPLLFHCAHCVVINKLDLLPEGRIGLDRLIANIQAVNPHVPIFTLSAQTGQGVDDWLHWLRTQVRQMAR